MPSTDVTRWEPELLRGALDALAKCLSLGYTDRKIAIETSLSIDEIKQLKEMLVQELGDLGLKDSPHQVYMQYKLRQESLIKELKKLGNKYRDTNQPNFLLGAINARSTIIDKIIKRGQELGVLPKEPEKHQLMGGILLADMTQESLHQMAIDREKRMARLEKNYGSGRYIEAASDGE